MATTAAPVESLPAHRAHEGVFPRILFAFNAICAWIGVGIGTIASGLGLYRYEIAENMLGNNTSAIGRIIDTYSYFTIWSNVIVAIVMTVLAISPANRGKIFKVLRLDSLVMITVTGILYWMLLAAGSQSQGIDRIGNVFDHTITPIVTVVVWLLVGPRNWIRWWMVPAALIIPVIWAAYTLIRGSVINAYPYPFLNVAKYGLPSVLTTIGAITVFGVILGLIFWGVDALLSGKARRSERAAAEREIASAN